MNPQQLMCVCDHFRDQQRGEDETNQRRGNERERERVLVLFIFSCCCDADLANVSERFLDKAFVDAPHELEIFTKNCSLKANFFSDVSTPKICLFPQP